MNTHSAQLRHAPFTFTGQGGEYFRIWIVNLALTLLTLGIYSAWAKVRRLQYFYRNTSLAGASFDYHGQPLAILKGRAIAVVLLVAYNFTAGLNAVLGLVALLVLLAVMPWLMQRSLCFRLLNSSYRGLRFRFAGGLDGAYRVFALWPLAGSLTLGLLWPLAHQRLKAYQHGFSQFGATRFGFDAGAKPFYRLYGALSLLLVVPLVAVVVLVVMLVMGSGFDLGGMLATPELDRDTLVTLAGALALGLVAFYLVAMLLVGPWFNARMQNLVWNATALGPHRFVSSVRARDLLVLYVTNFLGIVMTLGLFKPFADIRLARYRLEHMSVLAEGELDAFVADQAQQVAATGEEAAEVFDFDISF